MNQKRNFYSQKKKRITDIRKKNNLHHDYREGVSCVATPVTTYNLEVKGSRFIEMPDIFLGHESFHFEDFRLKSFKLWPKMAVVKPEILAENGFYFLKTNDEVVCVYCYIILGNWNWTDIVPMRHRAESPKCPFIGNYITGNIPRTVSQLLQSLSDSPDSHLIPFPNSMHSQKPPYYQATPHCQTLVSFESRQKTFRKGWNSDYMPISSESLAGAGFFYCDFADCVRCFHCYGGLCNWEGADDPMLEHRKNFSGCTYINLMCKEKFRVEESKMESSNQGFYVSPANTKQIAQKLDLIELLELFGFEEKFIYCGLQKRLAEFGYPYVNATDALISTVQSIHDISHAKIKRIQKSIFSLKDNKRKTATDAMPQDKKLSATSKKFSRKCEEDYFHRYLTEKTKMEEAEEENKCQKVVPRNRVEKCKICFEHNFSIILLPCKHMIMCHYCAACVKVCPICRMAISDMIKPIIC